MGLRVLVGVGVGVGVRVRTLTVTLNDVVSCRGTVMFSFLRRDVTKKKREHNYTLQ